MLSHTRQAAGMDLNPDLMISVANRFARHQWKYPSLAYALILRDAGALLQQMYLVATDLGLLPSAIGNGDSALFAEATGLEWFEEGPVAEFILSGA
jgi:SagB-type dehydrogenase family enzyme